MRGHLKIKYFLTLIFTLIFLSSYGQFDFKKKKIPLIKIDLGESLVYETNNALLNFSQKDILDYFKSMDKDSQKNYKEFIDTLITNVNIIHLISDDIVNPESPIGLINYKKKEELLSYSFKFIVQDFLLLGKVKPILKGNINFKKQFIIAKKEEGVLGSEYLVFYSSNKIEIFQTILKYGE